MPTFAACERPFELDGVSDGESEDELVGAEAISDETVESVLDPGSVTGDAGDGDGTTVADEIANGFVDGNINGDAVTLVDGNINGDVVTLVDELVNGDAETLVDELVNGGEWMEDLRGMIAAAICKMTSRTYAKMNGGKDLLKGKLENGEEGRETHAITSSAVRNSACSDWSGDVVASITGGAISSVESSSGSDIVLGRCLNDQYV